MGICPCTLPTLAAFTLRHLCSSLQIVRSDTLSIPPLRLFSHSVSVKCNEVFLRPPYNNLWAAVDLGSSLYRISPLGTGLLLLERRRPRSLRFAFSSSLGLCCVGSFYTLYSGVTGAEITFVRARSGWYP